LKELKDDIHITFAGVTGIKNGLCTDIHNLQLVESNAKPSIALAMLNRMGKWDIGEARHFLMDLMIDIEYMQSIIRKEKLTRRSNDREDFRAILISILSSPMNKIVAYVTVIVRYCHFV
jgi:hypothetical protein